MEERVLVIPESRLTEVGIFRGFVRADDRFRAELLDPDYFSFRLRSEVETDPSYKQLIPYVILRCEDQLFHYRRGSAGTEKRLTAKRSIGIGGHISTHDAMGTGSPYRNGMIREVMEEVEIDCPYAEQFLGFIYDDTTPVGAVHLGVVHLFELASMTVVPRESAIAEPGFAAPASLLRERDQFETWSQFVLDDLNR
jgi:predicted NUDIX family phosphoesterase